MIAVYSLIIVNAFAKDAMDDDEIKRKRELFVPEVDALGYKPIHTALITESLIPLGCTCGCMRCILITPVVGQLRVTSSREYHAFSGHLLVSTLLVSLGVLMVKTSNKVRT